MPLGARFWTLGRIRDHRAEPLPKENEDADWALAEAAPELLDVLRCLQAAIVGEINGIPNDLKTQLDRASAAIAKTRAETP